MYHISSHPTSTVSKLWSVIYSLNSNSHKITRCLIKNFELDVASGDIYSLWPCCCNRWIENGKRRKTWFFYIFIKKKVAANFQLWHSFQDTQFETPCTVEMYCLKSRNVLIELVCSFISYQSWRRKRVIKKWIVGRDSFIWSHYHTADMHFRVPWTINNLVEKQFNKKHTCVGYGVAVALTHTTPKLL